MIGEKMNLPWQATDVLKEFVKRDKRSGGVIGHDQLWHALQSGEVISVGAKALVELGWVIQHEHDLELADAGYQALQTI